MKRLASALLAAYVVCASAIALADAGIVVGRVNDIRRQGCGDKAGTKAALRASRGLDDVAREWSKGGRLTAAISRTDYRILNSSSMHIEGAPNTDALFKVLATKYCGVIVDPTFTEIGVFERSGAVWIVVATPFAAPSPADARTVSKRVLKLVNEARATARKCGDTAYGAVPRLELSAALERAALVQARDMAENDVFTHRGSDGSMPADRVTRIGYRWRAVGENIAAGATDADTVVKGWIASPGHCANIMSPRYQQMAVAYVVNPKSRDGIYWAQVFATPE